MLMQLIIGDAGEIKPSIALNEFFQGCVVFEMFLKWGNCIVSGVNI